MYMLGWSEIINKEYGSTEELWRARLVKFRTFMVQGDYISRCIELQSLLEGRGK
jgi:hypothetical protein